MKRITLGWDERAAARFRPIEELSWPQPEAERRAVIDKADRESCSYVAEGEGLGSSFSTVAEAIAFADFQGDTVVNRDAALAEHARRRGWSKR